MSDSKTNTLTVTVGEFLFEFSSFERWVAKASGLFRSHRVRSDDCIGIDTAGRICPTGKQYMRARDEGTFPIRVYRAVVGAAVQAALDGNGVQDCSNDRIYSRAEPKYRRSSEPAIDENGKQYLFE